MVAHSARVGGGGPVTPCQRVVAVPNGRSVVTLALILRSERNQGWRAVRRGHADDAATWFVSFGRVWRARRAFTVGASVGLDFRFQMNVWTWRRVSCFGLGRSQGRSTRDDRNVSDRAAI